MLLRFAHQQPIQNKPTPPNRGLNEQESNRGFVWGADSILPYQVMDQYDRVQKIDDMKVLEVSNGRLTALIAPHLGGRLLSLRDEMQGRELLFANPVFQPANLGSLNAWFSGGVEWNGLIPGHSPFSCSAIFAGVIETDRGPVLRLYEFDRIVEATWQIDLYLPPDDDRLYVHGRIVNADTWDKEAYWWTNVAVPATPGMRILSPADYAIEHVLPGNQLERFPFPDPERFDGSYPDNWTDATSVFFRTKVQQPLWMAALDAQGIGLAQTATPELQGRKLFYFGTGSGGQQWMDFLSQPGQGNYVEIQSGITPTQNQRFALAASSELHWTEAYASVQLTPKLVHQVDYQDACRVVGEVVLERLGGSNLVEIDAFLRTVSHQSLTERMHVGSPWGMRQEQLTGVPLAKGLDFSVPTPKQDMGPWDELLQSGYLSANSLTTVPSTWAMSPRYCAVIESSSAKYGSTWLHTLALGIAALNRGDVIQAHVWNERSLTLKPTWLAYRQRALLATNDSARESAYIAAWRTPGAPAELAVEIVSFLLQINRMDTARVFIDELPPNVRDLERIHIARAQIAAHIQDWALLARLLDHQFATIREGETVLDTLWVALQQGLCHAHWGANWTPAAWQAWQAQYPVPAHLNFRMQGAAAARSALSVHLNHSHHG